MIYNIFLDHQEKCYAGDQNVFIFSSQKNDFITFSLVIQEKCYDGDQNVFIFSSQKNDFITETLAGTGSNRNMFYMEQVLRGTSWNSLVHLKQTSEVLLQAFVTLGQQNFFRLRTSIKMFCKQNSQ